MDDRYQYQNRLVRLGRWLRWKPWYAFWAIYFISHWFLSGAHIPAEERQWHRTRRAYAKHIWIMAMSVASAEMKHVYTFDEVMDDLEER